MKLGSTSTSNTKFGFFLAFIFFVSSIFGFFKSSSYFLSYSALFFCFLSAILAFKNSELLTPFNKFWFLLGKVLSKVTSPIILGIVFFILITPAGLISKLFGRDELNLKRLKTKRYWKAPISRSSDSESFRDQF